MTLTIPDDAQVIYQNPILAVSTRTVGPIKQFATVHHPGAVAILAHDNDFYYLTKQFRPAIGREMIELPAGTREPNVEPDVTAQNELEEEIGKHAKDLVLLAGFYSSPGYSDEKVMLYRGWNLEDVEPPEADDSGTIEVIQFPMTVGGVMKGLEVADTAKTVIALSILLGDLTA